MFFWDPTFVLIIPAVILALYAQGKVKSAYSKYSRVPARRGLSGAQVAEAILRDAGIQVADHLAQYPEGTAVRLEAIQGELSDHYDPRNRTLRLSEGVYGGCNIAALGIAAHEVGHALQHAHSYAPLAVRNVIYPVCGFGSTLAWPLFIIGFFVQSGIMMQIGILLFTAAVFFSVLTLPVEFNASRRALRVLSEGGYLDNDELKGVRKVLSAAALTYVASAAMAILQLVRMLILADRD